MQTVRRNYTISVIRAIAMGMIIACHFCEYFESQWTDFFNCGVQIFFCISGYLYGKKKIKDDIKFLTHSFKKILLNYYLYLIGIVIIYSVFAREYLTIKSVIFAFMGNGVISGMGHLWFISYILFCYLLTPFLFHIGTKIMKKSDIKYAVFSNIIIVIIEIVIISYFGYFKAPWIACYIVAYFVSMRMESVSKKFIRIEVSIFTVLSLLIVSIYMNIHLNGVQVSERISSLLYQYTHSCFGIILFFGLYGSVLKFKFIFKTKFYKFMEFTDTYAYDIFIVHYFYILSPFSLMRLTNSRSINICIIVVLSVISGIILHKIVKIVDEKCCIPIWKKIMT